VFLFLSALSADNIPEGDCCFCLGLRVRTWPESAVDIEYEQEKKKKRKKETKKNPQNFVFESSVVQSNLY
jgi:hypothetical protein